MTSGHNLADYDNHFWQLLDDDLLRCSAEICHQLAAFSSGWLACVVLPEDRKRVGVLQQMNPRPDLRCQINSACDELPLVQHFLHVASKMGEHISACRRRPAGGAAAAQKTGNEKNAEKFVAADEAGGAPSASSEIARKLSSSGGAASICAGEDLARQKDPGAADPSSLDEGTRMNERFAETLARARSRYPSLSKKQRKIFDRIAKSCAPLSHIFEEHFRCIAFLYHTFEKSVRAHCRVPKQHPFWNAVEHRWAEHNRPDVNLAAFTAPRTRDKTEDAELREVLKNFPLFSALDLRRLDRAMRKIQHDLGPAIGEATDHIFGGFAHNPLHVQGGDRRVQLRNLRDIREISLALGLFVEISEQGAAPVYKIAP